MTNESSAEGEREKERETQRERSTERRGSFTRTVLQKKVADEDRLSQRMTRSQKSEAEKSLFEAISLERSLNQSS